MLYSRQLSRHLLGSSLFSLSHRAGAKIRFTSHCNALLTRPPLLLLDSVVARGEEEEKEEEEAEERGRDGVSDLVASIKRLK